MKKLLEAVGTVQVNRETFIHYDVDAVMLENKEFEKSIIVSRKDINALIRQLQRIAQTQL